MPSINLHQKVGIYLVNSTAAAASVFLGMIGGSHVVAVVGKIDQMRRSVRHHVPLLLLLLPRQQGRWWGVAEPSHIG